MNIQDLLLVHQKNYLKISKNNMGITSPYFRVI